MNKKLKCEDCGNIQEEQVNGKLKDRNWYLTRYVCNKCHHWNDFADVLWKGEFIK
jgi:hypothetical protein